MRIQARCTECGTQVELHRDDIELRVAPGAGEAAGGVYSFCCPSCGQRVERTADSRAIQLLDAAGVARAPTSVHPEDPPGGPPFGADDLLDLHLLLQRRDWFDVLTAQVEGSWPSSG